MYWVSTAAVRARTEVIQDATYDHGVKAWAVGPGVAGTDVGYVIPGDSPASVLRVDEVVGVARFPPAPAALSRWVRGSWSAACATP